MAKGKTDKGGPDPDTVTTPSPAITITVPGSTHCPYRRTTDLLQRLAPGKMRVGFLIGAGCPLAVQIPDGEKTKPLIPDITGLTKLVKDALDLDTEIKDVPQNAWSRVAARGISSPTVERSGPIRLTSSRSFLSGLSANPHAASLPVGSITA